MQTAQQEHIPIIIQLPNNSHQSNQPIQYSITTIRGQNNTTIIITPQNIDISYLTLKNNVPSSPKEKVKAPLKKFSYPDSCKKEEKYKQTTHHFLFGQQKMRKKQQKKANNNQTKAAIIDVDSFNNQIEVHSRFETQSQMSCQQSSQVSQSEILESRNCMKPLANLNGQQRIQSKTLKSYKSEPLIGQIKKCEIMNRLKFQLQQLQGKVGVLRQQNQLMSHKKLYMQ